VSRTTNADNRWSLADTLRYKFNLIGTKVGCDRGECGACAVLVDGVPMLSCMMLAVAAQGHKLTTVEGIGMPEQLNSIQAALCDSDGIMCGACVPGIVVVGTAFHKANPTATDAQWRAQMAGNLCKCGNWPHILAGLEAAT
jgi:aerobic-type carbon monoxide dehydrogenase small subunit (CoxS/CutS family)